MTWAPGCPVVVVVVAVFFLLPSCTRPVVRNEPFLLVPPRRTVLDRTAATGLPEVGAELVLAAADAAALFLTVVCPCGFANFTTLGLAFLAADSAPDDPSFTVVRFLLPNRTTVFAGFFLPRATVWPFLVAVGFLAPAAPRAGDLRTARFFTAKTCGGQVGDKSKLNDTADEEREQKTRPTWLLGSTSVFLGCCRLLLGGCCSSVLVRFFLTTACSL